MNRHGVAWTGCLRRRYRRARPLARYRLCHRLRHRRHCERQRMTPAWWAISECRMQFPRPRVASRIRIVGIAMFVGTVESSPNRIACEIALRMCARRTRGPAHARLGPTPCAWAPDTRVGPLICAWAAPPARMSREVDVRITGVTAHIQRFACELHARPGAVVSTSQTTSPATPHCWRLSPRWSALWAPRCPEPRPHRQQTGGIAPIEARHAGDTPWRGF